MKNILMLISVLWLLVLLAGCQCKKGTSLEQTKWKIGSFSDLKKEPVAVILSNSEPNLNLAKVLYKQDYSERAIQIVDLIKSAEKEDDHPEVPLFYFPEQLWVAFSDGTGSVFPCFYNVGTYYIRDRGGVRCSERVAYFLAWLRICEIDRHPKKKIAFDQIEWKEGAFSDLTKKAAIGMMITDFEPSLDFAKVTSKKGAYTEDVSEEAARIAYLFGHTPSAEDFPSPLSMSSWHQLWVAFPDGTGSVFKFTIEHFSDYCTIKADNIVRRSQPANDVLDLVRSRNFLRKESLKTGKEPCQAYDPQIDTPLTRPKDPNEFRGAPRMY